MTPSGTRTRSIRMPLGRVQDSVTVPIGSLSARTTIDAFGNGLDRAGVKREPIEKSSCRSRRPAPSAMSSALAARIAATLRPDRRGHELEGTIFLRGRGQRQGPGGRAGAAADLAHGGGDIAGSIDTFERRGHIPRKPLFRKTLVLGHFPITSGVRRRVRPPAHGWRGIGDNVDNPGNMQRINGSTHCRGRVRALQEVVMTYGLDRLPSRFPVGTKFVIEGKPRGEGQVQVFSRYLEFPDGTFFPLPVRPTGAKRLLAAGAPGARVRRAATDPASAIGRAAPGGSLGIIDVCDRQRRAKSSANGLVGPVAKTPAPGAGVDGRSVNRLFKLCRVA